MSLTTIFLDISGQECCKLNISRRSRCILIAEAALCGLTEVQYQEVIGHNRRSRTKSMSIVLLTTR
jgi:hypothetical protein